MRLWLITITASSHAAWAFLASPGGSLKPQTWCPRPRTSRGAGEHARATEAVKNATTNVVTTSAEQWLAKQGVVGPGAGPDLHDIAKAAREKRRTQSTAVTVRRTHARWGDPAVTERRATGGWAPHASRAATRSVDAIAGATIRSYRVSHILLASQELAEDLAHRLRTGDYDVLGGEGTRTGLSDDPFAAAARALSLCDASRDRGGDLGWVDVEEDDVHDDTPLLPRAAREQLFSPSSSTKSPFRPGDVDTASSPLGTHVVRCDDVLVDPVATSVGGFRRDKQRGATPMTYSVVTMGCQMNAADSERLEGSLVALGLTQAENADRADVVVLNTCSIRDRAEQKVYSYLGPYAARKRKGQAPSVIAVAGCVAQQEGERLVRRVPEIDAVLGPQYANRLGDVLERVLTDGDQVVATDAARISEHDLARPVRRSAISAWVNVMYGCNERCAFCVVPSTRGVEQSRTPRAILQELRALQAQGYKEATLLGQNVDAYGRDLQSNERFHELLEAAAQTVRNGGDGSFRLRFVTSHPRYMSDRVVDVVARYPDVLMPVFHVPAQSGDDYVLRLMGRGYSAERYKAMVRRIRAKLPDATITSDFIVGCPGESDAAFERTLALMRDVKFDSCMTAAYSPRPGTPMARWDGASDAFDVLLSVDDEDDPPREEEKKGIRRTPHELLRTRLRSLTGFQKDDDDSANDTALDALRRLVDDAFRRKAKMALGTNDENDRLRTLVAARDVAREAIAKIKTDPLFAFDQLAEIGPAQIDEDVKEERLKKINDLQKEHALERSQRYLHRVEPVLVEQRNTKRPEQVVGRTRGNKLVFFDGDADRLVGTVVDVRITSAAAFSLSGEMVPA